MKKLLRAIYNSFPQPKFTRPRNLKLFDWMNLNAPGRAVLNLGSGVGAFDNHLSKEIRVVNLDIEPSRPHLDIIADAHHLPIKNESFDIVYSIAVLEHTKKPWIVADEIARILRPGGYVVLELPFLNVIHDEHDYFRFTDKGIRSLFDEDRFEVVLAQTGSGGGSFISVFLFDYFRQFIPSKYLKGLWNITMQYPFSLLKYLDILIDRSPGLRITANSFSFIARKK